MSFCSLTNDSFPSPFDTPRTCVLERAFKRRKMGTFCRRAEFTQDIEDREDTWLEASCGDDEDPTMAIVIATAAISASTKGVVGVMKGQMRYPRRDNIIFCAIKLKIR
mmetsp:Transcript_18517/g.27734  ORF Transcript_18517/g.27734 Transcript_18517/m.27734 type:complete len:108 (+) Transcript_18517:1085-1408(+)